MLLASIQTKVEVSVDDDTLEDLAMALSLGSRWIAALDIQLDLEAPGEPVVAAIRTVDDPLTTTLVVTRQKLEAAIVRILEGKTHDDLLRPQGPVVQDLTTAILENDLGLVDVVTVDAIFQIALFNELIYG